jgi:hypothetical protein
LSDSGLILQADEAAITREPVKAEAAIEETHIYTSETQTVRHPEAGSLLGRVQASSERRAIPLSVEFKRIQDESPSLLVPVEDSTSEVPDDPSAPNEATPVSGTCPISKPQPLKVQETSAEGPISQKQKKNIHNPWEVSENMEDTCGTGWQSPASERNRKRNRDRRYQGCHQKS